MSSVDLTDLLGPLPATSPKARPARVALGLEQQGIINYVSRPPTRSGVIVVDGQAGTGKTTLIQGIVDALGDLVTLCAPTGKACARLTEIVGVPAYTIHQLAMKPVFVAEPSRGIYDRILPKEGKMVFASAEKQLQGSILIVDEASMIDHGLYEELLRFAGDAWLVLIGDSFQLPPVSSGFSVFDLDHKTFKLSKVHRQAAGSPVLEAATTLITDFAAGKQAPRDALVGLPQIGLWEACAAMDAGFEKYGADNFTTLTYKNIAREQITSMYRRHRGYATETIIPGEPLVATQNQKDLGIYNGDILIFEGWAGEQVASQTDKQMYRRARCKLVRGGRSFLAVLLLRGGKTFEQIKALRNDLHGHDETRGTALLQAEYGFVLTAHKAQGSQWDHVLIFYDEIFNQKNENRYRWCYTAVTRAAKSCTICYLPRNALTETSFQKPKPMSPEVAAIFGLKV